MRPPSRSVCGSAGSPAATTSHPVALPRRPNDSLVLLRDGSHPAVHELLYPLPLVRLRRVDVALRIRRDRVYGKELPWLPPTPAELRENLQRLSVHHVHTLILSVGQIQKALLGIA